MPRGKKHGPEEVIPKLREAEVLISQGSKKELAAKQIRMKNRRKCFYFHDTIGIVIFGPFYKLFPVWSARTSVS